MLLTGQQSGWCKKAVRNGVMLWACDSRPHLARLGRPSRARCVDCLSHQAEGHHDLGHQLQVIDRCRTLLPMLAFAGLCTSSIGSKPTWLVV